MRVARWHGALVGALFASALGLYVGDHAFFLVATIPLAYVVYGHVTGLGPPSLAIERTFDDEQVDPGDTVTVELTVENTGDRPIPDLRLVDGVPEDVAVADGSPAGAVALRPDESATVSYAVRPPRGAHEFGTVAVRGRSLAGTVTGTTTLAPDGDETLRCTTLLDEFPLQDLTTPFAGQAPTDTGGDGIEFHSIREYRRGDPLSHVDWRRLARTGELATVTHRQERAAAVVFVVDDRPAARCQPPQGGPSALDYVLYAASQGLVTLTAEGHRVGVTTLSPGNDRDWVSPGRGAATESAANALFDRVQGDGADPAATDAARTLVATDGAGTEATQAGTENASDASSATADSEATALGLRLAERLPAHAQVVFCTPLVDDVPVDVVETLLSNRHAVTVLSPNVTGAGDGHHPTPGQAVVDVQRRLRLTDLERLGVSATDWQPGTPLQVALADVLTTTRGWDR
ncbi:DUF58 domain-containing protein [Halorientalis regularis]|uniref:Conserved repeat domain-containing protein n=1 Tax=Halorientalis regularis TaxID=660518 RepID=A0A1G7RIM0_9EURY|nr:DUF58 domain-containing protein [Halorientalis regularis]SDG10618.1 conserved repeat domain-containing protein [Halorientalis regularis]